MAPSHAATAHRRIYVVEVNSTPWGPAELVTPQGIESAILRLAPAFARLPPVRGA